MSIEQTNDFHLVRRIVRIIAPDYRVFASSNIPECTCVLDVKKKTVEVGEAKDVFQTLPVLLFQLGHLVLKNNPKYSLFWGHGVRKWKGDPEDLIKKMARQGVKADRCATEWASSIFRSYWPDRPDISHDLMSQYSWDYNQWRDYFSSN